MAIRARSKKPITLAAVHPNAGLTEAYQKKLDALIDRMHDSASYWIKAAFRANTPEMAQDASPAKALQEAMRKLAAYWEKRFDKAAPELAKYFAENSFKRADGRMKALLKKSGFTVEFKLTREANDVLQATIGEQVSLIKSIHSDYFSEIQGLVMRSVSQGRDLATLSEELRKRYGVTKRRAALIARTENNKCTANITRVRQESLGITEAIWMHSHAGREPRPSHVAANGKKYKISEGMEIDGEFIWPGQLINCRCFAKSIIPGLED